MFSIRNAAVLNSISHYTTCTHIIRKRENCIYVKEEYQSILHKINHDSRFENRVNKNMGDCFPLC